MPAYESLAMALRGHYHKPFASIPPDIKQRILEDFAPWPWDSNTPRLRCHLAKQWDSEHDPALRELREGIEALTNPDSPAYSAEETRRLRGDFLPEPRTAQPKAEDLPPLEYDTPQPRLDPQNVSDAPTAANNTAPQAIRTIHATEPHKNKRRDLLWPLISTAQAGCSDPFDTPSMWAKLREKAVTKTAPFIGVTDEGLQWIDHADEPQYLSMKNLRDRLRRQKKATKKTR